MTISSILNSYSNAFVSSPKLKTDVANNDVETASNSAQSKSSALNSSVQISDDAKRLYEQSQKDNSKNPDWATDTTITTPSGEVIKTQWINVEKMLDAKLTADDKRVLGFPFRGKSVEDVSARTLISQAIIGMRDSGDLSGNITKKYLLGSDVNQLDLAKQPNFQNAEGQATLMDILSRVSV
jgi:hypothetical protein